MNSILLAILLTATVPQFEVQTLDGQTLVGPLVELTADRLVLVDKGQAREFDGTLDDYIAMVLAGEGKPAGAKGNKKDDRRAAAERREADKALKKRARDAEAEVARLTEERSAVDRAMFDPSTADPKLSKLTMTDLMKRRADLSERIEAAEALWMEASEALETA